MSLFRRLARLVARDDQTRIALTPGMRFSVDARTRITKANDDGRIAMHLGAGRVWAINAAGSQIWQLIANGESMQAIVDDLAYRYPVSTAQIERDVAAFVDRLLALNLIRPASDCEPHLTGPET